MRLNKIIMAAMAATLFVGISACEPTENRPVTETNVGSGSDRTDSSDGNKDENNKTQDSVAKIGGKGFVWEDGLRVQVLGTVAGEVSNQFLPNNGEAVLGVRVAVTNGTGKTFDATMFSPSVNLSYGPQGVQAETVFFADAGIEGQTLTSPIAPEATATGMYRFLVPTKHHDDITVSVTPGLLDEPAFFKS